MLFHDFLLSNYLTRLQTTSITYYWPHSRAHRRLVKTVDIRVGCLRYT